MLEEAVPGPTDPPGVVIEDNDLVLVARSDVLVRVESAVRALVLPELMRVTSRRLSFVAPWQAAARQFHVMSRAMKRPDAGAARVAE